MASNGLSGLLGLATRAGLLIPGGERALQAVRQGKAALILLDDGASANTRRRFENAAISHQIPLHILPPGLLESATGKAKAIVAALPQGGLTDKVRKACVENLHQKGQ
ncbi:MAG: 50S ribosomal protein L7ae [Clostridiales bacterium]|nr:50S ribosomal protein L7ae [Clostridiales bacterium]